MAKREVTPTAPFDRDAFRPRLTDAAMRAWIDTAVTGDRIEYYRGFLSVDTDPITSRFAEPEREEIARLAALARRSAEVGHVHLVQERLGDNCFSYVAVSCPWQARPRESG